MADANLETDERDGHETATPEHEADAGGDAEEAPQPGPAAADEASGELLGDAAEATATRYESLTGADEATAEAVVPAVRSQFSTVGSDDGRDENGRPVGWQAHREHGGEFDEFVSLYGPFLEQALGGLVEQWVSEVDADLDADDLTQQLSDVTGAVLDDVAAAAESLDADTPESASGLDEETLDTVGQSIEDLKLSTQDVSERTDTVEQLLADQRAQAKEITGEVSTFSATIEEVAATADQVNDESNRAEELGAEGLEVVEDTDERMDAIDDAREDVVADFETLSANVERIDEIVDVINEIADQTNILALNASIEAARAGEAGSGFAVVADEIKDLANESKEQVSVIEEQVGEIQSGTENTVDSLEEMSSEVAAGQAQIDELGDTFASMSEASREVSVGIAEVSTATDDLAASSEEIASTIETLTDNVSEAADELGTISASNEMFQTIVEDVEAEIDDL